MSKPVRHLKLACVLVCALLSLLATTGRAENASSEPALGWICKTDPMPAGFVAVGEMESPECNKSDPGLKNAWVIDKVDDKIVSCARPDYAYGYPPAIAYLTCERVLASQCPSYMDGTPNGFELTPGTSCKNSAVKSFCWSWSYDSPGYRTERVVPPGVPDFKAPLDLNRELEYWILSVLFNDESCNNDATDRIFYFATLRKGWPLPCARSIIGEACKHDFSGTMIWD
jgi:hypothetical protein